MAKRGELTLEALLYLSLSLMLLTLFPYYAHSYAGGELHYKEAIAKDLTMTVNQLYAMPGDARILYAQDVSHHTITIQGNTILVSSTSLGKIDTTARSSTFIGTPIKETTLKNPTELVIEKKGNTITISSNELSTA
jgi:hypothetical protein